MRNEQVAKAEGKYKSRSEKFMKAKSGLTWLHPA